MCAGHHNLSIVLDVLVNRSQSFRNFDVVSCEFAIRRCESAVRAMRRTVGFGAPKLTTNFACNSVVRPIGDVEKTAEFQRCGFKVLKRGGGIACEVWGRGAPGGFWVPGVSGRNRATSRRPSGGVLPGISGSRTLRGVRHRRRMITILIHIHVRST